MLALIVVTEHRFPVFQKLHGVPPRYNLLLLSPTDSGYILRRFNDYLFKYNLFIIFKINFYCVLIRFGFTIG